HGEALAGGEAAAERVPELRRVVRMDGRYDRFQPAHARLVHIRDVQAKEIDHALIEEDRLTVRSEPPDVARGTVHKRRELPLPFAQFRLGAPVSVEVDRPTVPSGDTALLVARRHHRGSRPVMDPRRAPDAALNVEMIAGLETVTPRGGDAVILVRMGRALEN